MRVIDELDLLPAETSGRLREDGFCVVPGPVPAEDLPQLARAYDLAMAEADPADRRTGSTTERVHDFVNRGPEFDPIYVYHPLLAACREIIARPFKLSALLGRTLLPGRPAQELHADCGRHSPDFPMAGFILMIDEFRVDNGATCFVAGSHERAAAPAGGEQPVPACGPAGSMIIYHSSVWHGHGANTTGGRRRSIQGAFVRRDAAGATDFTSRMGAETLGRLRAIARYVLAVGSGTAGSVGE